MWCDRIRRNISPPDPAELAGRQVDYFDIEWRQLGSMFRGRTESGEEVRIALPSGQSLSHGDVIFEDDRRAIVVRIKPTAVVVARPSTSESAMRLCLELGNLHRPTQMDGLEIIFLEEPGTVELLHRLAIDFCSDSRRFTPVGLIALPRAELSKTFRVIRGCEQNGGTVNQTGRCPTAIRDSFKSTSSSSANSR